MPAEPQLSTSVNQHMAPILRADGFKGSGATFRRVREGQIHVLNVQGSRGGGRFYINLSIQPLAIEDAAHRAPDPKSIKEYECEFRRRLGEWWEFARTQESMNSAVIDATSLYEHTGRALFNSMTGADGLLARFRASDLVGDKWELSGFGNTPFRMALNMMRLRKAEERQSEARAFADAGLTMSPPAPGWMRSEFEAVLGKPQC